MNELILTSVSRRQERSGMYLLLVGSNQKSTLFDTVAIVVELYGTLLIPKSARKLMGRPTSCLRELVLCQRMEVVDGNGLLGMGKPRIQNSVEI